jgi:hypothetical protein
MSVRRSTLQLVDDLRAYGRMEPNEDDIRLKYLSCREDLQEWNEFIRWMKEDLLGHETKEYKLSVFQHRTSKRAFTHIINSCPHIRACGSQTDSTEFKETPIEVHAATHYGPRFKQNVHWKFGDDVDSFVVCFTFAIFDTEMGFLTISYSLETDYDDVQQHPDDDEDAVHVVIVPDAEGAAQEATVNAEAAAEEAAAKEEKAIWTTGIRNAMAKIASLEKRAAMTAVKDYEPDNTFQYYPFILDVLKSALWPLRSPYVVNYLHESIREINTYDPFENNLTSEEHDALAPSDDALAPSDDDDDDDDDDDAV